MDVQELLGSWLANALGPACGAEPAAIVECVSVLLKRNWPVDKLKKLLLLTLKKFLKTEAERFVTALAETLRSGCNRRNDEPAGFNRAYSATATSRKKFGMRWIKPAVKSSRVSLFPTSEIPGIRSPRMDRGSCAGVGGAGCSGGERTLNKDERPSAI